jgi:hypothetical protein
MSFMDRFESGLQKGLDVSRDMFERARDKAKDLSEVGVLKFEIRQLETQVEKLLGQLGSKVFKKFVEEKSESIAASDGEVKLAIGEIEDVKRRIEEKELKVKEIQAKK